MANSANQPRGNTPKGEKPRGPPPALNPEVCAVVQPYKDFIGRGYISKMTIVFTPMGNNVSCTVQASLLKDGETADKLISVGDAKQRIIDAKLWAPKGKEGGKETKDLLPKKSLCKEDFSGTTDDVLLKRANAVAKALGDTTARGRIGSLKLMIEGVDTFEKWWVNSAPSEKSRLLADKKHHDGFSDADHLRLSSLMVVCPFRGPVPASSQEEAEEPEVKAAPPPATSKALVPKKKGGRSNLPI
jgi:hypothetical protein